MQSMEYEYKVVDVADGAISSFLLGEGRIETQVLQAWLNVQAHDGWRMVFMAKVMQRHLLLSDRETLMITFERRVPEGERANRASQCIGDLFEAEEAARQKAGQALLGAGGALAAAAVASALVDNSNS